MDPPPEVKHGPFARRARKINAASSSPKEKTLNQTPKWMPLALLFALASIGPSGAATAGDHPILDKLHPGPTTGKTLHVGEARGYPFCQFEVLTADSSGGLVQIYNTSGDDKCNAKAFDAIDVKAQAKKHSVTKITKVPVRQWSVDRLWTYDAGETRKFGDVQATWIGKVAGQDLSIGTDGKPAASYTDRKLQWRAKFEWEKGSQVDLLRAPEGKVFVMLVRAAAADDADLGSKLKLPAGWSHETKTLDEKLQFKGKQKNMWHVHSVSDDLQNVYIGCGFDDSCNQVP